jgi:hypothetical protein
VNVNFPSKVMSVITLLAVEDADRMITRQHVLSNLKLYLKFKGGVIKLALPLLL